MPRCQENRTMSRPVTPEEIAERKTAQRQLKLNKLVEFVNGRLGDEYDPIDGRTVQVTIDEEKMSMINLLVGKFREHWQVKVWERDPKLEQEQWILEFSAKVEDPGEDGDLRC